LLENCSALTDAVTPSGSAFLGVMPSEPPVWSRRPTMIRRTTSDSASVVSAK
jgi:hypothetical protein